MCRSRARRIHPKSGKTSYDKQLTLKNVSHGSSVYIEHSGRTGLAVVNDPANGDLILNQGRKVLTAFSHEKGDCPLFLSSFLRPLTLYCVALARAPRALGRSAARKGRGDCHCSPSPT